MAPQADQGVPAGEASIETRNMPILNLELMGEHVGQQMGEHVGEHMGEQGKSPWPGGQAAQQNVLSVETILSVTNDAIHKNGTI